MEDGVSISKLLVNIFPPLIFSGLIIWLILNNIYPYDREEIIVKNTWEAIALYVTSAFCFMCLLRFLYSKDKFFLWSSGMMMVFHVREIHPPNADIAAYLTLLWLFYYTYKNHHLFAGYICNKYVVTLLGVGFFTYVLAVSADERVWRDWIPIPGEQIFEVKLEETLEVLGHIAIGCALLFATKKAPVAPSVA